MSATNHTANYNLPQFVGTDKPTWLTDVNGAMSAIDTQMKANADTASGASSTATTTATNLGNIANLNTTDKTSAVGAINEINTGLGTVAQTASNASGEASEAKTAITALARYLTLVNFNTLTATATGANIYAQGVKEAVNADGTVGKIYGTIEFKVTSASGMTMTIPTSIRPTSAFTISGTMIVSRSDNSTIFIGDYNIATNGNITFTLPGTWYNIDHIRLNFIACMTFFTDFGDTPS